MGGSILDYLDGDVEIDLEAHPNYYDYMHRLILRSDGTCEFADGGGQHINGIWSGRWSEPEQGTLRLRYDSFDYGDLQSIDPIEVDLQLKVVREYTKFFNGYSLYISDE